MSTSSALVVVGARNILHAAFALCICFLGVGALYVFLHADFVAAVQLIVYVGGILVLIMFAIMFSSNVAEDTSAERRSKFGIAVGALAAVATFAGIFMMVRRLEIPLAMQNPYSAVDYANTVGVTPSTMSGDEVALLEKHKDIDISVASSSDESAKAEMVKRLGDKDGAAFYNAWIQKKGHYGIGHKLVSEYILPFEVVSMLLLAALLGAVVIVRKELK